jgi:N-acetylated-alpha-linked acidic dipeptidase
VPTVIAVPLSWRDAKPLLEALTGPVTPASWQGALPLTYRVGPGPATVRVNVVMDDSIRSIWVVEGRIRGTEEPTNTSSSATTATPGSSRSTSSGSATQLELAQGSGAGARREGPALDRFASWDARSGT